MDDFLAKRLKEGKVMLFLGAGASYGAVNRKNKMPPSGDQLAVLMADAIALPYDPNLDRLNSIAEVARDRLGDQQYNKLLEELYLGCHPSAEHQSLARYAWKRIYTTNIDDALDVGFLRHSLQRVKVINRDAHIVDPVLDGDSVQIIKLNGSSAQLHAGIVFSVDEYAKEANRIGTWYEELARDFAQYTFVFIGTKLDEPIFFHHVQRLIEYSACRPGQSYIICPSFTPIQEQRLSAKKIVCIKGTFADFSKFLKDRLGDAYSSRDMMLHSTPQYARLITEKTGDDLREIVVEGYSVFPVSREGLGKVIPQHEGGLRQYYLGNAPTWRDVLDRVPAELQPLAQLRQALGRGNKYVVVKGPAGCGKSTAIMQSALQASEDPECTVLFVKKIGKFPTKALRAISAVGQRALVVIDDFEWCHGPLIDALNDDSLANCQYLLSERTRSWERMSKTFSPFKGEIVPFDRISKTDASNVLVKLKEFGPWTRLSRMTDEQRVEELYERSRRQLLVGLKETTQGSGFEQIIEDEYKDIKEDYERFAVIVAAVATMHRLSVTFSTFDSVMQAKFGRIIVPRTCNLEGILVEQMGGLSLRHAVIADYLTRNVIRKNELRDVLDCMLQAFSRYQSPLRHNANNLDYQLYTAVLNHKFIRSAFRDDPESGLSVFRKFEKSFESDGLFWLHYAQYEFFGLGKGHRIHALEHIRLALQAYPGSYQILHAFAHMHFGIAVDARSEVQALSLMEQASAILEQQVSDRPDDPYPLVALCKGRVGVFRRWLPDKLRGESRRLVDRLRDASRRWSDDSMAQRLIFEISLEGSVPEGKRRSNRSKKPYGEIA